MRSDAAAELDRLTRGAQKKPNSSSGNNSLDNNINSASECWKYQWRAKQKKVMVYLLICASFLKRKKLSVMLMVLDAQLTNQKEPFEKYEMQKNRRRLCQLVVNAEKKINKNTRS